jgi:hypothetical protein
MVNTLDEALRILKNAFARRKRFRSGWSATAPM